MTSRPSTVKGVLLVTLLVATVLVAIPVVRWGIGAYLLTHQDETDGPESLQSARSRLTRVARASTNATMGPHVALLDLPEVGDANPLTSECGTFDTGRIDSPLRSTYRYTLAGVGVAQLPGHATDFDRYLMDRGWTRALNGDGKIELQRESYTLSVFVADDQRSVILKAETPCLEEDRP